MTLSRDVLSLSWEQFQGDTLALVRRVMGEYRGIVAVSRGGLVPAAIVATVLDVRIVETICIASYDGMKQQTARLLKDAVVAGAGEGWLVVDDLVDSGSTFRVVREGLPLARLAVVYAKPDGQGFVDDFAVAVDQQTWVRFPWELAEG